MENMNQTDLNGLHTEIKKQLALAADFYKPLRKYVILQGSCNFKAILAFNSVISDWVQIQINPIGHPNLDSLAKEEIPAIFGKRIKFYLHYYNPTSGSRDITTFDDEETIDVDLL